MNTQTTNSDLAQKSSVSTAARAQVVNRVHRIIREQALEMREQKQRSRSLWAPLAICSVLLVIFCYSIWNTFENFDLTPNDLPESGEQLLAFLLWSLPVTAVVLVVLWYTRSRNRAYGEV